MEEFKYKDFSDFLAQKNYPTVDKLDQQQVVTYNAEYLKEMRAHMTTLQEKELEKQDEKFKENLKSMEERLNAAISKQVEALLNVQKVQGEAIQKWLENGGGKVKVVLSAFDQSIEDNMEKIKKGKEENHTQAREFVVDLSGKATFVEGSVVDNTDALRLQTIGQLATRQLSIWDSLPKVPVDRDQNGTVRYTDWNEASIVRAAAMVAEGGTFPESTAVFQEYDTSLKKIGDTIPITEESLYDRARFAAELRLFLETNVNLIADQQVFLGDGTGNNMTGFYTTAIDFVAVPAAIADPSLYDLIVKVREAMTAGKNSKYRPDVLYMNIIDINRMKLKKDANNNYVMPPFVSDDGNTVDSVRVIESNVVIPNTLCMADSRYIRVYEEPGLQVSTGLSGNNFTEDMVTLKARRRAQCLVRQADRQGVYRVTDITAALVVIGS